MPPAIALQTLIGMLLAAALGAGMAVFALPAWLPGLSQSLLGTEPKAYWYLSRSSAFVAYILLWLSMVFGLLMTNKLARVWPGGPAAFDLHQHASFLGLAFALFHALILLGDRYMQATLFQVLVPFQYSGYEPLWVGLGQAAFYGLAIVGLSFYVKDRIGRRAWRRLCAGADAWHLERQRQRERSGARDLLGERRQRAVSDHLPRPPIAWNILEYR
jgi:predicted ferric reductase